MPERRSINPTSESFVEARLSARALRDFPGNLPTSLDEAYAIQNESIRRWPDQIAGWKVGGIPPKFVEKFGSDRLAGPIFQRTIAYQNGGRTVMPVFAGGFAAIEAEIVLRTDRLIKPGDIDPSSDDVVEVVPDAFFGVELASSPLAQINDLGPMSIISDFGNNAGLVIGDRLKGWPDRAMTDRDISVRIDGELVGQSRIESVEAGPIGAFRFLLANCAARGITIQAGTYISTGAITGVHRCDAGVAAVIEFEGVSPIRIALIEATPQKAVSA